MQLPNLTNLFLFQMPPAVSSHVVLYCENILLSVLLLLLLCCTVAVLSSSCTNNSSDHGTITVGAQNIRIGGKCSSYVNMRGTTTVRTDHSDGRTA